MVNKESLFASQHILMRAILMAQRTPAAGFTDTGIEKAAAKSTPAGKYKISVNSRNPRLMNYLCAYKAPFCAFLWLKNPRNLRNPWLINYLHAFGIFTLVKMSLQINLFMQNEPNFRKSQMNVRVYITKGYENKTLRGRGKKQSQTNPNKAKFKKAKMNVTSILTVGYENKSPIRAPKKQSQTSKQQKPMQTSLQQRIMKKTVLSGPGKTNPKRTQLVAA